MELQITRSCLNKLFFLTRFKLKNTNGKGKLKFNCKRVISYLLFLPPSLSILYSLLLVTRFEVLLKPICSSTRKIQHSAF
jgi:hypothetical protein